MSTITPVNMSSDLWRTPKVKIYDPLDALFHFDLDVCADSSNHLAPNYFTEQDSALDCEWWSDRCNSAWFMNPPYGHGPELFLNHAAKQDIPGIALVKAATDCIWWHEAQKKSRLTVLLRKRIQFVPPPGYVPPIDKKTGKPRKPTNNHGSSLMLFDGRASGFIKTANSIEEAAQLLWNYAGDGE